jgi:hypothetical protein
LRITYGLAFLVLFAYLEHVIQGGLFVAVAMAAGLFYKQRSWLSLILLLLESYFHFTGAKTLGYITFLAMQLVSLIFVPVGTIDKVTAWKPYEKEIRALLLERNPSLLHRVDQMLDEYKGKEKALLDRLSEMSKSWERPVATKAVTRTGGDGNRKSSPIPPSRNVQEPPVADAVEDNVEQKIRDLLAKYQPSSLNHIDRMLRDYRGQEHELLRLLRVEFEAPSSKLAKGTSVATTGTVAPKTQESGTNAQRQHSVRDVEALENARWEARNAIRARMNAAVGQLKKPHY